VEWSEPHGEGVRVLGGETPVDRLPVDWRAVEARKRGDTRKLQEMQGYVYTEGCRRGYVLRYFGEEGVERECGACDVCLGEAQPSPRRSAAAARSAPQPRRPDELARLPVDDGLLQSLRALRTRLARRDGVPPYCVFSDATLREMASARPRSQHDMLAVRGVGPAKLEKYGEDFLRALVGQPPPKSR
jgi:ATP-dependent DNA helicase RecQ